MFIYEKPKNKKPNQNKRISLSFEALGRSQKVFVYVATEKSW
jgi:hypothetical protein